ncbi:MAG: hypothetical protein JNM78_03930 [Cyclobacteriaceae bacterium]|nr:hypothetical protein [Cyclobacteriaceae bacterium]
MKRLVTVLCILFFQTFAFGQWAIPANLRAENTLDRLSDKGGLSNSDILYGVPGDPGGVVGDVYLNDKWNSATILLYQSETMIEGYPVKYDIKSNLIEIKSNAGIKVLDVRRIKNMVWKDSVTTTPQYFINGSEFKKDGTPFVGLLEVLVDGPMPLLKRTQLFVKQPTYNAALDVGSKDVKLYKKSIIFYAKDGGLVEVKNKKDVLEASGALAKEVEAYIKSNRLSISKDEGVSRAFEFINSKL